MDDQLIRDYFHSTVLANAHRDPNTKVVNELGINNGSSRADIAVLNGKLEGYEIKSEQDSLGRLKDQVAAYDAIFDRSFIVTCSKFLTACSKIVAPWWGIYLALPAGDGLKFKRVRAAKLNRSTDSYALARLLWRSEALELALNYAERKKLERARRHEIYQMLAENLKAPDLSATVLSILKQRTSWRASPLPPSLCDGCSQPSAT